MTHVPKCPRSVDQVFGKRRGSVAQALAWSQFRVGAELSWSRAGPGIDIWP